jgi:hypothetical protein
MMIWFCGGLMIHKLIKDTSIPKRIIQGRKIIAEDISTSFDDWEIDGE